MVTWGVGPALAGSNGKARVWHEGAEHPDKEGPQSSLKTVIEAMAGDMRAQEDFVRDYWRRKQEKASKEKEESAKEKESEEGAASGDKDTDKDKDGNAEDTALEALSAATEAVTLSG